MVQIWKGFLQYLNTVQNVALLFDPEIPLPGIFNKYTTQNEKLQKSYFDR